jgi:hypothetical protein
VFFFVVKSRVQKKTWNKSKIGEFICGYCDWCKKELLNTMGGWIINAEHKHFCHDGKDELCFDKYINFKKETNEKRLSQNKIW